MSVGVVILALNEAARLPATLAAVGACGVTALVVDGGSTDGTQELVRKAGHQVVERPFDGFASQRNAALKLAGTPYVLFVDADEILTSGLWADVQAAVAGGCDAAWIPTLDHFAGRWMLHGGWYPQPHLRLLRTSRTTYEGAVHERVRFLVDDPQVVRLTHPLIHLSHLTVSHYLQKLDRYTEIEAAGRPGSPWLLVGRGCAEAIAVIVQRLVLRRAWRDGPQGVVGAVSYAFYRFTVWGKAASSSAASPPDVHEAERLWEQHQLRRAPRRRAKGPRRVR